MWGKQAEQVSRGFEYRRTDQGIILTGYEGVEDELILPDEIGGEPVTGIGAYAFARRELSTVWLPLHLHEIGRYAFYRCRNLRKMILSDSLPEIGGGALTGCRIAEVEIHFQEGERSCLKSILDEIRYAVRARLFYEEAGRGREVRILFPEHYEEAVENTPARLLVTHHHGAGGYYRQCFYDRRLDYAKYDELLFRTEAEEEPETASELVLNRLRYPCELSEQAREAYERYLSRHLCVAAEVLLKAEDEAGLRFLAEQKYWTREAMEHVIDRALALQKTELLSLLMEEKRKRFPGKGKKRFEL